MSEQLKSIIEAAFERRADINPKNVDAESKRAVEIGRAHV